MPERYEVAIIGAGPGGYAAAIRSAQLGFKTICIDKRETLGGTCLNVGCIPSKTLLHATGLFSLLQHQGSLNAIECPQLKIDFSKLMERKRQVVKGLADGIAALFKKNGVIALQGEASFIDPHRLRVRQGSQESEIEADSVILATGSEPIALPGLPFNETQIVSSTGALSFSRVPKRLLVIGGGVIGVELASVYNRLGSSVTIIEKLDRLCPAMDCALTKQLLQLLNKQGIQFKLSSQVVHAVVQPNEVILTVETEGQLQNVSGDAVLVAVGRKPCSQGLGLEKIDIAPDRRGYVPVDGFFRTQQPHIFAIGDLIDGVMLAHRSTEEGIAVVEWLKGKRSKVNYLAMPNVIYTDPEVASVGLTEEEAKESGRSLLIGTSFFRGNARARCTGETEGWIKVIGDQETGRLMGMHIIGSHASELIGEGVLAMQLGATLAEIGEAAQAHPTLGEAMKEAALQALGRPIHS